MYLLFSLHIWHVIIRYIYIMYKHFTNAISRTIDVVQYIIRYFTTTTKLHINCDI